MPDTNGEIPLTGDPRVDAALERIRGKFQELEDALLVQAHLEKRQSARADRQDQELQRISRLLELQGGWMERHQNAVQRHQQSLEQHDRWLEESDRRHEQWKRDFEAKMLEVGTKMAEIEDKLNLLIGREMKREGGSEGAG
jgi:hypothetical protein